MHDQPSAWLPDRLTCREFTNRIAESLDHRMAFWTELRLWMHLTRCADCCAYAEQLRLLRHALPLIPHPAVPLSTRLRLRQKFIDSRSCGRRERPVRKPAIT